MIKHCFHDGFPIDEGKPTFTFPVAVKPTTVTLSKLVFCSLACVKAHLVFSTIIHPNRLEAFTMYVSRKYGTEHVSPAPARSVLACYRTDGGITIEKFREHNQTTTFGIENKTVSQVVVNEMPEEENIEELLITSKQLDSQYQIDIATDRGDEPVVIVGNHIRAHGKKTSANKRARSYESSSSITSDMCTLTVSTNNEIPTVSMEETEIAGADTLHV